MNKQEIEKAIHTLECARLYIFENSNSQDYSLEALDRLSNAVDDAKSALKHQLTNGWIPVSERLPNIGETVLLTVAVNRGISHEYGSVDIAWICDKENKCFYGTDGKYSYDEAIAWQPLPEPYKEVSDETNIIQH